MNLSMSELLTEETATQRDNKRRDLTRPVYIPGQTFHPDELQKIAFNDPKTKQQYYFCKDHGFTLWSIPKEEPLCHELHRLLKPCSKRAITLFSKTIEPKHVRSAHLCAKKFDSVRYYTNFLVISLRIPKLRADQSPLKSVETTLNSKL